MPVWDDTVAYTSNSYYIITLNCSGEKIQCYINGGDGSDRDWLFTVEDNSLIAGKIGLYCSANKGACFDEVRVAPPIWVPFYTFREEQSLPAGTRFHICSGNYKDMPSDKMKVDHKTTWRFAASLDDHGKLRFPEGRIDLRLYEPGQPSVGHTRRFLNNGSNYKPVEATKLLRKADGTSMFIVLPSDSRRPGQYRLKFSYKLDKSGGSDTEPHTQKFREGGSSEPEVVTLDIPWESYVKSD